MRLNARKPGNHEVPPVFFHLHDIHIYRQNVLECTQMLIVFVDNMFVHYNRGEYASGIR